MAQYPFVTQNLQVNPGDLCILSFRCQLSQDFSRRTKPAEVNGKGQRSGYRIRDAVGEALPGVAGRGVLQDVRVGAAGLHFPGSVAPRGPAPSAAAVPPPLAPDCSDLGWPDFPAAPCGPGMPSTGAVAPALGAPGWERAEGRGGAERARSGRGAGRAGAAAAELPGRCRRGRASALTSRTRRAAGALGSRAGEGV